MLAHDDVGGRRQKMMEMTAAVKDGRRQRQWQYDNKGLAGVEDKYNRFGAV
jgi:hypothetical protein